MKIILSILYTLLRTLPSNPFLNKVRGYIVSKLVNGECKNLRITRNVILVNWQNITIGNNVIINPDSALIATESKIVIGDNVLIAPKVFIQTQNHNFKSKDTLIRFQGESMKDVIIGDDVWVAYGVIVLPGCKIASGSVIGAGSVVTSDLESYSINVGSPARKIGERI
jgi:acetyltransferase-like isoleucine patch superfamily enzyme